MVTLKFISYQECVWHGKLPLVVTAMRLGTALSQICCVAGPAEQSNVPLLRQVSARSVWPGIRTSYMFVFSPRVSLVMAKALRIFQLR